MKLCPKCNQELQEKNDHRWCRNGCEIYTAMPHGSAFDVMQRDVPDNAGSNRVVTGGLRRTPRFDE